MAAVQRETQRRHPQRNQWVDIEPCEERVGDTAGTQYVEESGPQCGGGSTVNKSVQEPLGFVRCRASVFAAQASIESDDCISIRCVFSMIDNIVVFRANRN